MNVLAYALLVGVQRGIVKDDKRRDVVALKIPVFGSCESAVPLSVKSCEHDIVLLATGGRKLHA